MPQRFDHCTHPDQTFCDCDWCRFLRPVEVTTTRAVDLATIRTIIGAMAGPDVDSLWLALEQAEEAPEALYLYEAALVSEEGDPFTILYPATGEGAAWRDISHDYDCCSVVSVTLLGRI
jgi:hypothetical protein